MKDTDMADDLTQEDPMKSQAALQAAGEQMRAIREAALSKEWNVLERPYPVAHLYADSKRDKLDLRDHDFERMVSAYMGLVAQNWIEPYLALHAKLVQEEHLCNDSSFEFGNDAYVWACADREVPQERDSMLDQVFASMGIPRDETPTVYKAKAFVVETQSRNFLVILNEKYGRWHLHIRRFWADLREVSQGKWGYLMDEYADRKDLTLEDVIKLAHQASEHYGDAWPDVSYPRRPFLSTLLEGDLIGGSEKSGIGLRYADFRDVGYVVSFKNDDSRPEVDSGLSGNFHELAYVAYNIASAHDQLVLADDDEDDAPAAPPEDAQGT